MPLTGQITDIAPDVRIYFLELLSNISTVCARSGDSFYIATYYIKWVTTPWTDGTMLVSLFVQNKLTNAQLGLYLNPKSWLLSENHPF